MNAIRIRKTIDSDTLHLPELADFMGHTVDIVIEDSAGSRKSECQVTTGTGDWDSALAASQHLEDYDFDAQRDQGQHDCLRWRDG